MIEVASLMAQMVKSLLAVHKTWVRSLGPEDPLEKEMATHSSILGGDWQAMSIGSKRVGHD